MRITIFSVDGERLVETGHSFVVTVKRLQRAAAIVPCTQVLRRRAERAIERMECVGMPAKLDECSTSIVECLRVLGCARKNGIEVGEGLFEMTECSARDAAVEKRIP